MLVVHPREFVNIFSLNHHWNACTGQNEVFWERQLCGLLFLFVRNEQKECTKDPSKSKHKKILPSSNDNDTRPQLHCNHLLLFYNKYFFNRMEMKNLLHRHQIFRMIFKEMHSKLLDFIGSKSMMTVNTIMNEERLLDHRGEIIDENDISVNNNNNSQPITLLSDPLHQGDKVNEFIHSHSLQNPKTTITCLIKSIFISCYNSIKAKKNGQHLKEELGLVAWNDFNWRSTGIFNCDYFDSFSEIDYHLTVVGNDSLVTSIAKQHLDLYWKLLLHLKETDEQKIIRLQKRFLTKYTEKNASIVKEMVTILRETSISFHECVVQEKPQTVSQCVALDCIFDSLSCQLKFLGKEMAIRVMKYLVVTFMVDCFSHPDLYIAASVFQSLKNYFEKHQTYKQIFEQTFEIHYSKLRRLSIKANDERSIFLLEFMLNSLRFSSNLYRYLIYNHNTASDVIRPYYSSLSAKPTLFYIDALDGEYEYRAILLQCKDVYLRHGKDEKQFWKDVKNDLRQLCGTRNIEKSKSMFYVKQLFESLKEADVVTKSNMIMEAKKLFSRAWGLANLEASIEWTKFFVNEFNISPVKITYEWTSFSHYFTSEEIYESSKNFPEMDNKKKKKGSKEDIEFKDLDGDFICNMNPICDFVLCCRVDDLKAMLKDQFLAPYLNDVVTVPFLYDTIYPRPVVAGDESIVYCVINYDDKHRLYLKKMKLKQLILDLVDKKEPKN
ncbi:hypothetical protein FDP41_002407 [Naegleria fowleri]|uniref:Uncharacterized protein n=1 Tax=Naegleria fowleri TaxID=5763 RepID=A0A6A5BNF7_NAEFO|nr:uncharacterized protein FDP41_002407 [Naegleria fowleri]KAF0978587.1 hypothetical protein FDP41_002407 [Naegleria fowleri]